MYMKEVPIKWTACNARKDYIECKLNGNTELVYFDRLSLT